MIFDIIDITGIITSIQLLILAIFLLKHKKGNRLSHLILCAFLFSNALYIIDFLLFRWKLYLYHDIPFLYFIGKEFGLLFGPLLFLYTKSVVFNNFKLSQRNLLHFVPFLAFTILLIYNFHIHTFEEKSSFIIYSNLFSERFWNVYYSLFNLQILAYMYMCLRILYIYKKEILTIYSSIERINLSWLRFVLWAFIWMWIIDLLSFLIGLTGIGSPQFLRIMILLSLTINFIFANYFVYRVLNQPEIISGIDKHRTRKNYDKSGLAPGEINACVTILERFMQEKKPFLSPALTINDLSEQTGIPVRQLSQIINGELNQNFYYYINAYRIKEAQKLLKEESDDKKTVLEILYDVGFNSKSSFNTEFKKLVGMTPTQYRRLQVS